MDWFQAWVINNYLNWELAILYNKICLTNGMQERLEERVEERFWKFGFDNFELGRHNPYVVWLPGTGSNRRPND